MRFTRPYPGCKQATVSDGEKVKRHKLYINHKISYLPFYFNKNIKDIMLESSYGRGSRLFVCLFYTEFIILDKDRPDQRD